MQNYAAALEEAEGAAAGDMALEKKLHKLRVKAGSACLEKVMACIEKYQEAERALLAEDTEERRAKKTRAERKLVKILGGTHTT